MKKLENELDDAKLRKHGKPSDPDLEFCFEGNKKQYKLNCDVLDKIKRAKNMSDDKSQTKLLEECEQLLLTNDSSDFVAVVKLYFSCLISQSELYW